MKRKLRRDIEMALRFSFMAEDTGDYEAAVKFDAIAEAKGKQLAELG